MERDATTVTSPRQGGHAPVLRPVAPPAQGESAAVVRAAAVIAVAALLWIGRDGGGERDGALALDAPWQVRFAELEPREQRLVRELHEAALELLRARDDGPWPEVAALAGEGIAPFATAGPRAPRQDVARAHAPFAWQYAGRPLDDVATPWLLQVLEPQPGELEGRDPSRPLAPDEQHRRLRDGTLLHVSFWIGRAGQRNLPGGWLPDPARFELRQVLSGLPPPAPQEVPR